MPQNELFIGGRYNPLVDESDAFISWLALVKASRSAVVKCSSMVLYKPLNLVNRVLGGGMSQIISPIVPSQAGAGARRGVNATIRAR